MNIPYLTESAVQQDMTVFIQLSHVFLLLRMTSSRIPVFSSSTPSPALDPAEQMKL